MPGAGKNYSLSNGVPEKGKAAATAKGRAHGVRISDAEGLASHLKQATDDSRTVLIPGHFIGNVADEPFDIVFEKELADLLGKEKGGEALAEVHNIAGRWVAARLKRSIEPCCWQLLDFDSPPGMPTELADLDIAGRLARMEKVVPGISRCERIEARSSSARVVEPGGVPGPASHAWIRISDPALVDLWRVHIQVEAALHGLTFLSPRSSRKTGDIVGQSRLTLFDLAVLVRGRIVFCSAPTIDRAMTKAGWSVADAGVAIVNPGGGALDISDLTAPKRERLVAYRKETGEQLEVSGHGASFAVVSRGVLELGTEIETDHAPGVRDLRRRGGLAAQERQERPPALPDAVPGERSWAAIVALDTHGNPFLHDVGTSTTYRLVEEPFRHVNADGTYWQELEPRHDVRVEHFRFYQPQANYIFMPDARHWVERAINSILHLMGEFNADGTPVMEETEDEDEEKKQVRMTCAGWLRQFRPVQQVTWHPGKPQIINSRLINEAGWVDHPGAQVFNQYRPAVVRFGDARKAGPWVDFVRSLYPDSADRLLDCLAYKVQHPEDKINRIILLLGAPGIGKDFLLMAVRYAVGEHNYRVINPRQFMGRFNGFRKSVILQVSEAHDPGGTLAKFDRYGFYEEMKDYGAAPPDFLLIDEKNKGEYWALNVMLSIITSNNPLSAFY